MLKSTIVDIPTLSLLIIIIHNIYLRFVSGASLFY